MKILKNFEEIQSILKKFTENFQRNFKLVWYPNVGYRAIPS